MGEKGNVLTGAQVASAGGASLVDQALDTAGEGAALAGGVVVSASTDLAQDKVRGHLERRLDGGDEGQPEPDGTTTP